MQSLTVTKVEVSLNKPFNFIVEYCNYFNKKNSFAT